MRSRRLAAPIVLLCLLAPVPAGPTGGCGLRPSSFITLFIAFAAGAVALFHVPVRRDPPVETAAQRTRPRPQGRHSRPDGLDPAAAGS
jgi:hypothetical protein